MQVILRRAILIASLALTLVTVPVTPRAQDDQRSNPIAPRPLASALAAATDGNWTLAKMLAERDGPVASDYIEWIRLRAGRGTPTQTLAFLDRNPHWPGLAYLRKQNEPAFKDASDEQVRALFAKERPSNGASALRLAKALENAGQKGEAQATIVLAWRTLDLDEEEHDAFRAHYGDLLSSHHSARLFQAIWEGRSSDTNRMLGLVSDLDAQLARTRLALKSDAGNVNALISALSKDQQNDPGLAYDRFIWRIKKGLNADAKDLLIAQSAKPGGRGFPEKWANHRRAYARGEMRSGDPRTAYELASAHQLTEGSNFADLEWLAGYIALRYLNDGETALNHFDRLENAVQTPISLGRAGYWRGRALETLNRPNDAQAAYRKGGEQQTSFYGLLAAEKVGLPFDQTLAGREEARDWQATALASNDIREAVMLLRATGLTYDAERFLTHLAETASPSEIASLGKMLEEAGDSHLEVMLGKAAASRGLVIPRHYYAVHSMTKMDLPVSMEMALAIARRESEFDPSVTSHVGARGLMQLMPRTAQAMAKKVGDTDGVSDRLGYWAYNAKLGSAYLSQLSEEFTGNVLLISAGYNAGPSRSWRWSEQFGDPRDRATDPVDWIEPIPFRETRKYVQLVAESLPIYRARLGREPLPIPFSIELSGSTVLAFPPKGE